MADAGESGWSEAKLKKAGANARRKIEQGIEGFERLVKAVKKAHAERQWVKGLDGRRIISNSDHSALNTLLQGGGAIVMKKALALFHFELAVEKGWVDPETLLPKDGTFAYCANVHDEVQMSVHPSIAEEAGKTFAEAIRLAGERLGLRCPLSGAYEVGNNWAETH